MREKIKTTPDLLLTSPKHQGAVIAGDEHFRSWERNVVDHFKDKTEEEIKTTLRSTASPFSVCMEHVINDFNMGTVIRNANGFNAREVFYLGDKKWDKRAAVGVYNYTPVCWLPTLEDFKKLKERYHIIGIDNIPGSISMSDFQWQPETLMVFGEEGVGLTPGIQELCEEILYIPMFGSVRSFNCGVASGITMYDFLTKVRK